MEEDVGVSGRANTNPGARWDLHGSLVGRAGLEEGEGRGKERAVGGMVREAGGARGI